MEIRANKPSGSSHQQISHHDVSLIELSQPNVRELHCIFKSVKPTLLPPTTNIKLAVPCGAMLSGESMMTWLLCASCDSIAPCIDFTARLLGNVQVTCHPFNGWLCRFRTWTVTS
jgi:hypothetical protein